MKFWKLYHFDGGNINVHAIFSSRDKAKAYGIQLARLLYSTENSEWELDSEDDDVIEYWSLVCNDDVILWVTIEPIDPTIEENFPDRFAITLNIEQGGA